MILKMKFSFLCDILTIRNICRISHRISANILSHSVTGGLSCLKCWLEILVVSTNIQKRPVWNTNEKTKNLIPKSIQVLCNLIILCKYLSLVPKEKPLTSYFNMFSRRAFSTFLLKKPLRTNTQTQSWLIIYKIDYICMLLMWMVL